MAIAELADNDHFYNDEYSNHRCTRSGALRHTKSATGLSGSEHTLSILRDQQVWHGRTGSLSSPLSEGYVEQVHRDALEVK